MRDQIRTRRLPRVLSLFFILLPAVASSTDPVERALSRVYAPELRWDNVEGDPFWVEGVKPAYDVGTQRHVLHLPPGSETTVRLPSLSMLRMVPHGPATPLRVFLSNGSGLWIEQPVSKVASDESLLVAPDDSSTMLARIRCAQDAPQAFTGSAFISRYVTAGEIAPHRKEVAFRGETVQIRQDNNPQTEKWAALAPHTFATWTVTGPKRIELQSRLNYSVNEARRKQWYQLSVELNDQHDQSLDFYTEPETQSILIRTTENSGSGLHVGELQSASISVPEGMHQIKIRSTARVFLRIHEHAGDYLFPAPNGPQPNASQVVQAGGATNKTIWNYSESELSNVNATTASAADIRQVCLRSSRDNRFANGGTQAMLLMRHAAAQQPGNRELRQEAETLRGRHSIWKSLVDHSNPVPPQFAYFTGQRLKSPTDTTVQNITLFEPHVDDAVRQMSRGQFFSMGNQAAPSEFVLPPNHGDTQIRIVLPHEQTAPHTLHVQFDDAKPIVLLADRPPRPNSEFSLSTGQLALTALARREAATDAGTLGGPFSRYQTPGNRVSVATAEVLLPADVNRIRVWTVSQSTHNNPPQRVCLQIRQATNYRLTETEFLEMWGRLFGDELRSDVLISLLQNPALEPIVPENCPDINAWHELRNHYVPLATTLHASAKSLHDSTGSLQPQPRTRLSQNGTQVAAAPPKDALNQLKLARQLSTDKRWLPALEAWNRVPLDFMPEHDMERRFARIEALQGLGENFLATAQLRAIRQHAESSVDRDRATSLLLKLAQQNENEIAAQSLFASEFLNQPRPKNLLALGKHFAARGRYQTALLCAVMLPPGKQRDTLLVATAFQEQWWQTFESVVLRLGHHDQQFWKGQRALSVGRIDDALQHFANAGPRGSEWTSYVENSLKMIQHLKTPAGSSNYQLLADWTQQFAQTPGKRVWKQTQSSIRQTAGTHVVDIPSLDQSVTASLSTGHQPTELNIIGPAKLKLEFRPVHQHATSALTGWVNVNINGTNHPVAVVDNTASPGLRLRHNALKTPGTKITREFELTQPGWHKIQIHADAEFDVLTRAFTQLPVLNPGILPTPTQSTVAALESGRFAQREALGVSAESRLFVMKVNGRLTRLPLQQQPLIALSELAVPTVVAASPVQTSSDGNGRSRVSSTQKIVRVSFNTSTDSSPLKNLGTNLKTTDSSAELTRRMEQLVWLSEMQPDRATECRIRGFELARENAHIPGVQKLQQRLLTGTKWKRVSLVRSSAGMRTLDVQGWHPESPDIRVRKSLLPSDGDYEIVLNGRRRFVAQFESGQPASLNVTARLQQPDGLKREPVSVTLQIDDQAPETKRLLPDDDGALQFEQTIDAGAHTMRIGLTETSSNQFVCVSAGLTRDEAAVDIFAVNEPILHKYKRAWHVGTKREPLTVRLPGPGIVRVDEKTPNGVLSRFVVLKEKINEFEVVPEIEADESLFRVFRLVDDPFYKKHSDQPVREAELPSSDASVSQSIPLIPAPLLRSGHIPTLARNGVRDLSPLFLASPIDPAAAVAIHDQLPLMNQEDGTWSGSLAHFERRPLEETIDGRQPDRFQQVALTHRFYGPTHRNHMRTDVMFRARQHSGDSFGLKNSLRHDLADWPVAVTFDNAVWTQRPDDTLPGENSSTEWATFSQARVTQSQNINRKLTRTRSVAAFNRWLSVSEPRYLSGEIDQDIFTTYKADHRFGYRLAELLQYRPWLDTRLWAQGTVASNENLLTVDYLSVRGGVDQLLGPLEVSGAYRVLRFLNDGDRNRASTRQLLYFDATLESWPVLARSVTPTRSEIGVSLQHEPDDSETSLQVFWSMFLDNGRLYRDYKPGERRFRNLQRRRALARPGNELFVSDGPLSEFHPRALRQTVA